MTVVFRRRAELLVSLAKLTRDPCERQRLTMLAAEELERAATAERNPPAARRQASVGENGAEA